MLNSGSSGHVVVVWNSGASATFDCTNYLYGVARACVRMVEESRA